MLLSLWCCWPCVAFLVLVLLSLRSNDILMCALDLILDGFILIRKINFYCSAMHTINLCIM